MTEVCAPRAPSPAAGVGSSLGRGYVYDAFGRLVEVRKVSARSGGTGSITASTAMAEYRYDGLGQRIAWHRDFDAEGSAASGGGEEGSIARGSAIGLSTRSRTGRGRRGGR